MGFIKNAIYLTLVCQLTTSCGDAEILLERILGKAPGIDHDEYVPVPGSPASDFLSKTFADETVGTTNQLAAMNVAIDDQAQMNLTAAGLLLHLPINTKQQSNTPGYRKHIRSKSGQRASSLQRQCLQQHGVKCGHRSHRKQHHHNVICHCE